MSFSTKSAARGELTDRGGGSTRAPDGGGISLADPTLNAIHLASALVARTAIVGLTLLSLDDRVRKAGKKLGLDVIPD
jgi:hypothetical protein